MRCLVVVLLSFSFGLIANGQDAASIIQKVVERNKALQSYRVEGTVEISRSAGPATATTGGKFLIEADGAPPKLHLEYQTPDASLVFITNGSTIWTYAPREKVYTKVDGAQTAGQGDDQDDDADRNDNLALTAYSLAVQRYSNLDKFASQPQLAGEDWVKTSEGKSRCWVIRAAVSGHIESFWVDQQRYLVLRSEANFEQSGTRVRMKFSIKRFETEPPSPDEFTFIPGKHAKLVDELNIPGSKASLIGKPAIDFALKSLDGESVRLSELRGKIVILDFWATWCGPCRSELPTVNKLAERFKDKDVVFLGINDEGAGTVKSFNKKYNYTLTTLEDKEDKVYRAYRANAIPSVFVIGKDGTVRRHFVGAREESEFIAALHQAGVP